jgi:hypothetical protein
MEPIRFRDSLYEDVLQDKNDALSGERLANLRMGEFVKYISMAGCFAFIAILLAISYALRHRTACRNIEATMESLKCSNMPIEARAEIAARLGRSLPIYPKDRLK